MAWSMRSECAAKQQLCSSVCLLIRTFPFHSIMRLNSCGKLQLGHCSRTWGKQTSSWEKFALREKLWSGMRAMEISYTGLITHLLEKNKYRNWNRVVKEIGHLQHRFGFPLSQTRSRETWNLKLSRSPGKPLVLMLKTYWGSSALGFSHVWSHPSTTPSHPPVFHMHSGRVCSGPLQENKFPSFTGGQLPFHR